MIMERFFRKTKGAISIFMAIVLFSMVALTGVIIDASRIRSGEANVDSAVDVAANSMLAQYDQQLKEFFGLMALSESDSEKLAEDFKYYINRTLMVDGLKDDKAMTSDSWDRFQSLLGQNDKQKGKGYLDIYDFTSPEVEIEPLYSLAEADVLRNQIVDHMKFRAPMSLGEEIIDKINALKGYQKQTETFEKKLDIDKEIGKIDDDLKDLGDLIRNVNKVQSKDKIVKERIDVIISSLEKRIAVKIRLNELEKLEKEKNETAKEEKPPSTTDETEEKEKTEEKDEKNDLEGKSIEELNEMSTKLESKITDCFEGYDDEKGKHNEGLVEIIEDGKDANDVKEIKKLMEDIKDSKKTLDSKSIALKDELKNDNSELSIQIKDELEDYEKKLSDGSLDKIIKKIEANYKMLLSGTDKEIIIDGVVQENGGFKEKDGYGTATDKVKKFIDELDYSKIKYKYDDEESIKKYVKSTLINKEHMYDKYFAKYLRINPDEFMGVDEEGDEDIDDPREFGEDVAKDDSKNPANKVEGVDEEEKEVPEGLPSEINAEEITKEKMEGFKEEDDELVKFMMTGGNSKDDGKDDEKSTDIDGADEVLEDVDFDDAEFAKNAISKVTSMFAALEKGAEAARDELYVGEYAMGTFSNYLSTDDEKDLRGITKSTKPTFFDNEVEYILNGSKNEQTNVKLTQSKILLTRFTMNTLYIYTDKAKKAQTLAAATVLCTSFLGFGAVATKVVQNLMMLSWAMAESVYDLKQIMGGESVVLYKTRSTWNLDLDGMVGIGAKEAADGLKDKMLESFNNKAKDGVSYGTGKASDVSQQTFQRIKDMIDNRINLALDRVMKPVEDAIYTESDKIGDNLSELETEFDKKAKEELGQIDNQMYKEAVEKIYDLAKKETLSSEKTQELLDMPKDEALIALEKIKDESKKYINKGIDKINQKLKNETSELIEKASKKANKEVNNITEKIDKSTEKPLNDFIDSFGNGGNSKVDLSKKNSKPNIKSSMVTFDYGDYLRVFLLITPREKKVLRIGDLIQLNMHEMGNSEFNLVESNTYVRIKTVASMKYMFMTSGIVPEKYQTKGKHDIKSITYKGY